MTRRIPGLGLGAALLVASELCSAMPYRQALDLAHHCTSDTSWAEQVAPDDWRPVCGDELGRALTGRGPVLSDDPDQEQASATSCWLETDADGVTRTYCGTHEQHVCGLYAQWAYWACEHGYPTDSDSCDDAADLAVEECGSWQ